MGETIRIIGDRTLVIFEIYGTEVPSDEIYGNEFPSLFVLYSLEIGL